MGEMGGNNMSTHNDEPLQVPRRLDIIGIDETKKDIPQHITLFGIEMDVIITSKPMYKSWPDICAGKMRPTPHTGIPCAGEKITPCGDTGYCGGMPEQVMARLTSLGLPTDGMELN